MTAGTLFTIGECAPPPPSPREREEDPRSGRVSGGTRTQLK
jgi:hypothetical protein